MFLSSTGFQYKPLHDHLIHNRVTYIFLPWLPLLYHCLLHNHITYIILSSTGCKYKLLYHHLIHYCHSDFCTLTLLSGPGVVSLAWGYRWTWVGVCRRWAEADPRPRWQAHARGTGHSSDSASVGAGRGTVRH